MYISDIEVWKPIKDFPDYEVSNLGNVRSVDRYRMCTNGCYRLVKGKMLKPHINRKRGGYIYVTLSDRSKHHTLKLHRLVAEAFIPNPENKPCINHLDFNKANNTVANLEWTTAKENSEWNVSHGKQARPCEKKVVAIDPHTGKTMTFRSTKDAERNGYDRAAIWRVITGEYKTHKGLIWQYAN